MRQLLIVGAPLALLLVCTQDPQNQDPQSKPKKVEPVTVILLRHAEGGDRSNTNDPELSDAGKRRAKALVRLLGNAGVTHLFASKRKRTRMTVAPLAKSLGLEVSQVPATKYDLYTTQLQGLPPGSTAVVAGHSNTLPPMIRKLGAKVSGLDRRGMLGKDEFDRVFVLTLPVGKKGLAKALELRYGISGRGK